jgi:nicotinic acetylcholine receptor alpha-7
MNNKMMKLVTGTSDSADLMPIGLIPNGEYDVVSLTINKTVNKDTWISDDVQTFDLVIFTVGLERRSSFYLFNNIIPTVMLMVLGSLVFWVPCDSGEKITLGISALLTLFVFLQSVSDMLPPTASAARPLLSEQISYFKLIS